MLTFSSKSPTAFLRKGQQFSALSPGGGANSRKQNGDLGKSGAKDKIVDKYVPKRSNKTNLDKDVLGDGDTWIEIAIKTKPKVKGSDGKQEENRTRSLFYSVNKQKARWDEPPSGASRIIFRDEIAAMPPISPSVMAAALRMGEEMAAGRDNHEIEREHQLHQDKRKVQGKEIARAAIVGVSPVKHDKTKLSSPRTGTPRREPASKENLIKKPTKKGLASGKVDDHLGKVICVNTDLSEEEDGEFSDTELTDDNCSVYNDYPVETHGYKQQTKNTNDFVQGSQELQRRARSVSRTRYENGKTIRDRSSTLRETKKNINAYDGKEDNRTSMPESSISPVHHVHRSRSVSRKRSASAKPSKTQRRPTVGDKNIDKGAKADTREENAITLKHQSGGAAGLHRNKRAQGIDNQARQASLSSDCVIAVPVLKSSNEKFVLKDPQNNEWSGSLSSPTFELRRVQGLSRTRSGRSKQGDKLSRPTAQQPTKKGNSPLSLSSPSKLQRALEKCRATPADDTAEATGKLVPGKPTARKETFTRGKRYIHNNSPASRIRQLYVDNNARKSPAHVKTLSSGSETVDPTSQKERGHTNETREHTPRKKVLSIEKDVTNHKQTDRPRKAREHTPRKIASLSQKKDNTIVQNKPDAIVFKFDNEENKHSVSSFDPPMEGDSKFSKVHHVYDGPARIIQVKKQRQDEDLSTHTPVSVMDVGMFDMPPLSVYQNSERMDETKRINRNGKKSTDVFALGQDKWKDECTHKRFRDDIMKTSAMKARAKQQEEAEQPSSQRTILHSNASRNVSMEHNGNTRKAYQDEQERRERERLSDLVAKAKVRGEPAVLAEENLNAPRSTSRSRSRTNKVRTNRTRSKSSRRGQKENSEHLNPQRTTREDGKKSFTKSKEQIEHPTKKFLDHSSELYDVDSYLPPYDYESCQHEFDKKDSERDELLNQAWARMSKLKDLSPVHITDFNDILRHS